MPNDEKLNPQEVEDFSEKELLSWEAQSRPFKKLNRNQWIRLIIFCALFSLILFIAEGAIPVFLVVAVVFFFYVLSTVDLQKISYTLTNKGVKISNNLVVWDEIKGFYFGKSFGNDVLILDTLRVVSNLSLVIDQEREESVRKILIKYIPEKNVPTTNVDKVSGWFSKKILGN